MLLVPKAMRGDQSAYIMRYGTNALFGEGFPGAASNVYGLAGEAMLNFGPVAGLGSFAVLGYLVGRFRRFLMQLPPLDMRWILVPLGSYLCVTALVGDSDNFVYALIKEGFVPFLIVFIGSYLAPRPLAESYEPNERQWEHGYS
jgi:hypothetical protein